MKFATHASAVALALSAAVHLVACGGAQRSDAGAGRDAGSGNPSASGPVAGASPVGTAGQGNGAEQPGTSGTDGGGSSSSGTGGLPPAAGGTVSTSGGDIVPLFNGSTALEPEVLFEQSDAVVTRWGDRGRDRHAREEQFQSYDHYLPHYWEDRTARFSLTDHVAKGGTTIELSWVTEWKLDKLPEFRAWYNGNGSVAQYTGNYGPRFKTEGPGTYDNEHVKTSEAGTQYKYTYTITSSFTLSGQEVPLAVGQFMEIEASQFLDTPPLGRDNYYGTVFLYEVGKGGMVPWYAVGKWEDKASERENSHKLGEKAWLGGRTTLPYQYSDEPNNHFMQMATNLSPHNAQAFVRGRRVHHTDMLDGTHDESVENGIYTELTKLSGPNYVNRSCDSCHKRNGRAQVAEIGVPLDKWVFKVAAADGSEDPFIGSVLQPYTVDANAKSEGSVSIAQWLESADKLRRPVFAFSGQKPAQFSARIAPQLVGLGLLEAIPEQTILAFEDVNDSNGDGISGKAQIAIDPITGQKRLGRFGWKAAATSLKHQISAALNTDMGVMTSVLPKPDCGAMQKGCGNENGPELSDDHLADLTKYISLLGIRARRDIDDADALRGEVLFGSIGCTGCHRAELTTSKFHPLAELRNQVIHPYTDLLLHDMGPGLADHLSEHEATGAEWRTTPLWGLGLSACVTGGVAGEFQHRTCTPHHDYLHDGRARSIEEAILWHGGEGEVSKKVYAALPATDQAAVLKFLGTL